MATPAIPSQPQQVRSSFVRFAFCTAVPSRPIPGCDERTSEDFAHALAAPTTAAAVVVGKYGPQEDTAGAVWVVLLK